MLKKRIFGEEDLPKNGSLKNQGMAFCSAVYTARSLGHSVTFHLGGYT